NTHHDSCGIRHIPSVSLRNVSWFVCMNRIRTQEQIVSVSACEFCIKASCHSCCRVRKIRRMSRGVVSDQTEFGDQRQNDALLHDASSKSPVAPAGVLQNGFVSGGQRCPLCWSSPCNVCFRFSISLTNSPACLSSIQIRRARHLPCR